VVSCCEVLEHLPFSEFGNALKEICRVSKKYSLISLPDVTQVYRINLELPRLSKPIKKLIHHPFPRPAEHIFNGEHYWEIGKKNFPLKKIIKSIEDSGFSILKTYRVFEYYYHRIFVTKKN